MTPPGSLPLVLAFAALTGGVTVFGGGLALKFRAALPIFLGAGSGIILGVALFDLLPDALALLEKSQAHLSIMAAVGAGFYVYLFIDRLASQGGEGRGRWSAHLGPLSLTLHSLTDGLGMGFAFQTSISSGLAVAGAILAHDLLDGANTVTLALQGGARAKTARSWLVADALAPLAGVLIATNLRIAPFTLGVLLALYAGFFLYIGGVKVSSLSYALRPKVSTTMMMALGLALFYVVARIT